MEDRKPVRMMPSERAELMELDPDGEENITNVEVSTRRILIDFHPSKPWEDDEKSATRAAAWKAQRKAALTAVNKFRNPSLMQKTLALFQRYSGGPLPLRSLRSRTELDLRAACQFYFPQKSSIQAQIVDFRADRGVCYWMPLGKLESYLAEKPKDVLVRWIHCPVGVGFLQSTIEEIFNYSGSGEVGRRFEHAGSPAWPFIDDFHQPTFHDKQWYEEQIRAWNALSTSDPLEAGLLEDIDVLRGMPQKTRRDLVWRSNHVRRPLDFWHLCKQDLPNLPTDALIGDMSLRNRRLPQAITSTEQAIAEHKSFQGSVLLLSAFRSFQRSDGFLLTFSQQPGVDYIGNAFREWLDRSNDKEKQHLPWKRGESVRLVRRYLSSLDELRVLLMVTKKKIRILRGLLEDVTLFEEQHKAAGDEESAEENAEPMPDMVTWVLGHLGSQVEEIETLIEHFQTALNELFQLRSIEQNELAIAADSQNKAILLFTGVTVIFLPLSFFTSYFGMNLQGVQNSPRDERFFWATCGVAGFLLVALLLIYGFRAEIIHRVRKAGGMQDPYGKKWNF